MEEDLFLCSVCYATTDVMRVTTTCGHHLCFNCTTKLVKQECPYCRTPFPADTRMPIYNDYCKDCRGNMGNMKKCCENGICTLCLMNQINEDTMDLVGVNTKRCIYCYIEYPGTVQQLLQNKRDSLLRLKDKCRISSDLDHMFSKPQTLSYSLYDTAYNQSMIGLPNPFR